MSGYDPKRGIFQMTATKLSYWFRREDLSPQIYAEHSRWEIYKICLENAGLQILKDGGSYLDIKGTPEQIWEALSGKPSTFEHSKHYYEHPTNLTQYPLPNGNADKE